MRAFVIRRISYAAAINTILSLLWPEYIIGFPIHSFIHSFIWQMFIERLPV